MAILVVFLAHTADYLEPYVIVPSVSQETIEKLLTIISSTMLAVATFAVASMLSAYGSASSSATPRAFMLVLTDDVSQVSLSSFIGAFIFSIVSIIAIKTGYYEQNGHFVLFLLTISIFGWVIITFVRWVDNIARLGRIGTTIDMTERATLKALTKRTEFPFLGGNSSRLVSEKKGETISCEEIGYLQFIDMPSLQNLCEELDIWICLDVLPGSFLCPGKSLANIIGPSDPVSDEDRSRILKSFIVGNDRSFEDDPRFGLIVLSEIAARALSPGVNDPGTAIVIVGRFVRLIAQWDISLDAAHEPKIQYDRVFVPDLSIEEMFDDAFTAIARDGAGYVELGIRLQKAFASLAALNHKEIRSEAIRHSRMALARAEMGLKLPEDIEKIRDLSLTK